MLLEQVSPEALHEWAGLIFAGRPGCRLALKWAPALVPWRIETTGVAKVEMCPTHLFERVCWEGKEDVPWWDWARSLSEETLFELAEEGARPEEPDSGEDREEDSSSEAEEGKRKKKRH